MSKVFSSIHYQKNGNKIKINYYNLTMILLAGLFASIFPRNFILEGIHPVSTIIFFFTCFCLIVFMGIFFSKEMTEIKIDEEENLLKITYYYFRKSELIIFEISFGDLLVKEKWESHLLIYREGNKKHEIKKGITFSDIEFDKIKQLLQTYASKYKYKYPPIQ